MTGQLESLTPDIEVQNVCDEIGGAAERAYNLLLKRRKDAFAAAIEPLDAEKESLTREHGAIGEAARNLELLLPARAREAQRDADRLMLDGKHEEAAAKIAEAEEAAAAPEAMKERQREISARIEAIAGERKAIATRCFEAWYAELQHVIRASERGLFIELLDKTRDEMYTFQERHGLQGLIKDSHLSGLTADEHSVEWKAGQRWYEGRR
jgi:hypothetical protein